MRLSLRLNYLLCACVFFLLPYAQAQTPGTGSVEGVIRDSAGLPVAFADVWVTNESTQSSRKMSSTSDGTFHSLLLVPGTYHVRAAAPGFSPRDVVHLRVSVGEPTVVSLTLGVATSTTQVNVSAESDIMQTDSATLGRTVNSEGINTLPLSTRNFTQILSLSPGVIVNLPNATTLGLGSQNVATNGQKTTANNVQFNGIDANNIAQNSAEDALVEVGIAVPAPDTIQEFKVQTANYDASYGRGTGANVDMISKAGTNQFHGTVWEFLRNDLFVANLFFSKLTGQFNRPILKQNQFGASVGGPILHNRLFFFGAYQGLREVNGLGDAVTAFLPALSDDRSATSIGSEFCGFATLAGGTQLACDGSNINPVALALLQAKLPSGQFAVPNPQKLLPLVPGQIPTGESTYSIPAIFHEDQYTANLDATLSTKDQLVTRFFYSQSPKTLPFAANASNVPGWGSTQHDQNVLAMLGETHLFSSNLINLARVGYTRFSGRSSDQEPISAAQLGTQSPTGTSGGGIAMPGIFVNGLFSVGDGGTPFLLSTTNSFIAQDSIALMHRNQSIRAGVEGKHHEVMIEPPYVSGGVMEMETFNDFLIGQSAAQNGSPIGYGNIYLTAAASGIFRKDQRYNEFSAFIQDDIGFTSNFKLFAGLRYEIYAPPTEAHNRFATFDPSIAAGSVPNSGSYSGFVVPSGFTGTLPLGVTKLSRNGFWPNHFGDVSPRVGFSWKPLNAVPVLLRGGYGIYFDRLSAGLLENLVGQPPFALDQTLFFAQTSASSEQIPFSPLLPPANTFPSFVPRTPSGAQSITAVDPNITDPYTQEYNLNIQTEFARNWLLEIGYIGNHATHIPGGVEFNQATLASPSNPVNGETTNTAQNITNRLPYAGISTGSIIYQTRFQSNFNSLQASLTKRMSDGLQLLFSYTYSRSLDETSGTGGSEVYEEWLLSNDQHNPSQAYGPTDFDRTHRAVLSLVYNTPSLRSSFRAGNIALRDWTFSAIGVVESGNALTVTDGNAGAVYGNFENRAQKPTGNPYTTGSLSHRAAVGGYLNASVFPSAPQAPFSLAPTDTDFGNSSTGILRGPVQRNIDFSLERSIPIVSRVKFIFRSEFFNATNTPNFGDPNTNVSSGVSFGKITGTSNNPRIIQFAGKIAF